MNDVCAALFCVILQSFGSFISCLSAHHSTTNIALLLFPMLLFITYLLAINCSLPVLFTVHDVTSVCLLTIYIS